MAGAGAAGGGARGAQTEVAAAGGAAVLRGPARGGDARGVWASAWHWHSHADYLRDGNRVADAHSTGYFMADTHIRAAYCNPRVATPDPNEVLDTVEKQIQAIKQAALAHHGSIPVEVVLDIAGAESGPPYGWSNEQGVHGMPNTDGVMQVTGASGYKSVAAYANTRASIETNIRDAVANLTWNLNTLRSRPWGDYGTTFDDLVNSEIIRTLLHYNADNWPIELYAAPIRQGTPRYLGRIADSLEAIVPPTFGLEYMNPGLVQELRVAQELVYDEIRKRETP